MSSSDPISQRTRAPIFRPTEEQKLELKAKYESDEYSLSDLSREYRSNPTTISKYLKEMGVTMRKPGVSQLQIQRASEANRLRGERQRRERDERRRQAAEQAESRDEITVEGISSVGIVDWEATRAANDAQLGNYSERIETTWSPPAGEGDPHAFSDDLNEVEQRVRHLHSFTSQLPEGRLRWVREGEQVPRDQVTPTAAHQEELDKAHAFAKEQWDSGVRYGYDQATKGVADLLRDCIKETVGHAADALEEFLGMLEDGEHFYRQRKDKKPWLNPRNWEDRR